MSKLELPEFVDTCQANGIYVDGSLYYGINSVPYSPDQPNAWTRGIVRAGIKLSNEPKFAYVNEAIPEDFLGDYPTTAQLALLGILNTSLNRVKGITKGTTFKSRGVHEIDMCGDSEINFGYTIDTMHDPDTIITDGKGHQVPVGWTIFTENGLAVAASKDLGPRALYAFEPFVVNGVLMPKGMMYAAKVPALHDMPRGSRNTVDTKLIRSLTLQRLTAFAMSPSERMNDFPELVGNSSDDSPVRNLSLERIQEIAQLSIAQSDEIRS